MKTSSLYQVRLHTSQEQWDTFVSAQPNGHLLQSWGWGELKSGAGWHPLRLALWDSEQETMVAAAQVLRGQPLQLHLSVPLWTGHLAYIPKGPLLDWSNPPLCKLFLSQLHNYLSRHGALALQMELGDLGAIDENMVIKHLASLQFHPARPIQPLRTSILDLTPDEDILLAHMKEKWRYNIRLAGRKGVKVRAAQSAEDVRAWYKVLQITSERDHFGIHTLDYYLRAWHIFALRNQARLFLAEYEGQLLAGIFVGLFAKQALYLYGASSNEHRSLMPNYLLQWEAIRWAKSEGATRYDFWGIAETNNQNEALAGVSRFKSGWGGQIVQFPGNYEYIYRPLTMRVVRKLAVLLPIAYT